MAGFEGAFTDSQNWARQLAKEADINKGVDPSLVQAAQISAADTQVVYQNYLEAKKNVKIFGKSYVEDAKQSYLLSKQTSAGINAMVQEARDFAKNTVTTVTNTDTNTDGGIKVGGSLGGANITATPPAPEPEVFSARMFSAPPVKTATLDIILFDEESVPTDGMFDQIFENIGGQELISITRSDIVNGQKISYQPIKNLSAIQQRYNPNNILSLQQTADKFFAGFSIKLEDKIPETGNGTNGENIYLNATGDLIIELINVNPDEQVETQISVSGTIYEADLGDYTS
jgi:hypothetical protein